MPKSALTLIAALACLAAGALPAVAAPVYCALDDNLVRLSVESQGSTSDSSQLQQFRGVVSLKKVPVAGMHKNFRLTQDMLETSKLGTGSLEFLLVSESKTENPFVTLTLKVTANSATPQGESSGNYQLTVTSSPHRSSLDQKTVLSDVGRIYCKLP